MTQGKVEEEMVFHVPPRALYQAFLDKGEMIKLTHSPAEMDGKVGGEFQLFDGSVHGKISELKENELIVQDWRFKDWEDGVFSRVEIKLEEVDEDVTCVTVTHTNIPKVDKFNNARQEERVQNGWKERLLGRIARHWCFPVED